MMTERTPRARGPKGPQACYVYDAGRHHLHVVKAGRGTPGRGVVDPVGRQFAAVSEAAAAYGLTPQAIGYRARARAGGWRYADDSP
jgi:hypothetical protein